MVANLLGTNAADIARWRKYLSRLLLGLLRAWLLRLRAWLLRLRAWLLRLLATAFALGEMTLQPLGSLLAVLLAGQVNAQAIPVTTNLFLIITLHALLGLCG